jgi:Flp pilus assembly pilin Flp
LKPFMKTQSIKKKSTRRLANFQKNRKGAAVVEFAVCLPVILIIVLGSIQAASMMFLRQTMVQCSYEAAKVAVSFRGTPSAATDAARRVAQGRRISNMDVRFSPSNFDAVAKGQPIEVIVSAPGNANSLIPFGNFANRSVSARAVMVKE